MSSSSLATEALQSNGRSAVSSKQESGGTIRIGPDELDRLQQLLETASPGTTISLRPGVYRASFVVKASGTAEAPITIEAEEPGRTIFTGTDEVTGWGDCGGGVFSKEIDLRELAAEVRYGDLAGIRVQVFIDGVALRPVLNANELTGGTFHYDEGAGNLRICPQPFTGEITGGSASIDAGGITGGGTVSVDRSAPENRWQFLTEPFRPERHTIEVTVRSAVFQTLGEHDKPDAPKVEHLIIRGLVFRGSGDRPQLPMVRFGGSHLLIEDCLFEAGAARGFDLRTNDSVMRRCVARLNGQMGFSGYGSNNLVEDCALLYNNTKHKDFAVFEQGGSKICRTDRWTLRRIRCVGNDGPGIWFDIDNTNALIECCWCEGNSGPGIMYEISSDATIRNNILYRNGFAYRKDSRFDSILNSVGHAEPVYGQGILVQMSRRVTVHNNTCVGNRRCGIELRHHPYQQAGNPGHATETYRLEEVRVFNNILADNAWDNLIVSIPPRNESKQTEVRNIRSERNFFHSTEALIQHGGNLHNYCRWGKTQSAGSCSLEEWRASRDCDLDSIQWEPAFIAPDEKDFRIEAHSAAAGRGLPVDGLETDYHGRPRPTGSPAIGACEPVRCNDVAALLWS